jgi:hypothetical protein
LKSLVPKGLRWLGPLALFVTKSALARMISKYNCPYNEDEVRKSLTRVRVALDKGSKQYLLDYFSYAGAFWTIRVYFFYFGRFLKKLSGGSAS